MSDIQTHPVLRLLPKSNAQRLRFGAPWVYADQVVLDRRTKAIPAGSIVEIQDKERKPIALAAFNAKSKIIARVLDRDLSASIDQVWFEARIRRALTLRETLFDTPFYRLIHAEADGMPGVIIDRFGDTAVIQPNAAWADERIEALTDALVAVSGITNVLKNANGRARTLEGLNDETITLRGEISALIQVPMNAAIYMADLLGGQKTGLYYDQRPNHAFAARLGKGRDMLDVFSHVGGFSLAALAGGATGALAVDGSTPALELATKGAAATGVAARLETRKGDAFDTMIAMGNEDRRFGIVVCDPPAFAPSKQALESGLRAYERIARLGAKLVEPGGYLVLCSCSHAADLARFREISLRGVGKAGRRAQIVHTGAAGADHPTHPYLAETSYLKALFLRLD
ncbi:MAG: class I SAM-dependent rRNA methyltransferase [Paracoccaceae bacterium]